MDARKSTQNITEMRGKQNIWIWIAVGILALVVAFVVHIQQTRHEGLQDTEPTAEIVVARYKEELKWLNESPFNDLPYIVYNKGGDDEFLHTDKLIRVEELPNVGCEVHTYLHHIIANYDNLADMTVFLVGSTDSPNKHDRAKRVVENALKTGHTTMACTKHDDVTQTFYDFAPESYTFTNKTNAGSNPDTKIKPNDVRPYGKWFEKFFVNGEENKCINYNSLFAVRKDHIRQRPKEFYEKLIREVDDHWQPEAVHFMERSWYAVFYPYGDQLDIV